MPTEIIDVSACRLTQARSLGHCSSIGVVVVICPASPMTVITLLTTHHVPTANLYKRQLTAIAADSADNAFVVACCHLAAYEIRELCAELRAFHSVTQLYCL